MAVFFCVAAYASKTSLPHMMYKGTHLLSLMTSHAFNDEELVFHGNRVNTMEIVKKNKPMQVFPSSHTYVQCTASLHALL